MSISRGIPTDSSAYIAAFDALEKTDWLTQFVVSSTTIPGILNVLNKKREGSYEQAVEELIRHSKSRLEDLGKRRTLG